MAYAESDAARLRTLELHSHDVVRVLLLDPFRSRSSMIEVPVVVTGPHKGPLELGGINLQVLENVLRVPTARHSYRENVRARPGLETVNGLGRSY